MSPGDVPHLLPAPIPECDETSIIGRQGPQRPDYRASHLRTLPAALLPLYVVLDSTVRHVAGKGGEDGFVTNRQFAQEARQRPCVRRLLVIGQTSHRLAGRVAVAIDVAFEFYCPRPAPPGRGRRAPFAVLSIPPIQQQPGHGDIEERAQRAATGKADENVVVSLQETKVYRLGEVLEVFSIETVEASHRSDHRV